MLGIDLADLIKEETQIQKAVHVGNLTVLRENFQETVSASPIIQKENHMLGIDLADLTKEAIQIQKADHVGNLTDLRENFQETVSASLIISHTHQKEHPILGKEIESQDLIKEAIQIQKADHVGNLTGPKGNFQGTVRASHLIQKENHMLGIDLTELFK
jgi:sporulation protein YlmC with PRC-barrel domain